MFVTFFEWARFEEYPPLEFGNVLHQFFQFASLSLGVFLGTDSVIHEFRSMHSQVSESRPGVPNLQGMTAQIVRASFIESVDPSKTQMRLAFGDVCISRVGFSIRNGEGNFVTMLLPTDKLRNKRKRVQIEEIIYVDHSTSPIPVR